MRKIIMIFVFALSLITLVGCDVTSMAQFNSALNQQNGKCNRYHSVLQTWSGGEWKDGLWYPSDISDYDLNR